MADKRILLFVFLIMFLIIPSVSAFEFDNVKTYDPVKNEVTIKNIFGLGADIAKVKLNTPMNNRVPRGYQKVAEFTINGLESYSNILKELELYDKRLHSEKITRDFDYKYLTYETVVVNEYEIVCNETVETNKSTTKDCNPEIKGTHLEDREKWIDFTLDNIIKGDIITVGIFTDVQKGDIIEWVPNMYGVRINEWAVWTEDLSVGLIAYFPLNETTGTNVEELINSNNGTTQNMENGDWITPFKNGGGLQCGGTDEYVLIPNHASYNNQPETTICFNLREDAVVSDGTVVALNTNIWAEDTWTIYMGTSQTNWAFGGSNNAGVGGATTGVTKAYCTRHDEVTGDIETFINGTRVQNISGGTTVPSRTDPLKFCGGVGSLAYAKITLNHVFIWNRSLSNSEISDMYNGGAGIPYSPNSKTTTQNAPADNFVTTSNFVLFNCSATAVGGLTVENISLYTNQSGTFQQENVTTGLALDDETVDWNHSISSEGNYLWGCLACDSSDDCLFSDTNRTVSIDQTLPVVSATNLTDLITMVIPINSTWNLSATDTRLGSCWYNTTDHATSIETCGSIIKTTWASGGSKSLTYCANDTAGNVGCLDKTITVVYFNITATDSKDPIGEGDNAIFTLDVEATGISSLYPDTNASFNFNKVNYTIDTKSTTDPDKIVFTKTLAIPNGSGNATGKMVNWSFDWDLRNTTGSYSSGTSTSNITILNMTFYDNCTGKYTFLTWNLYDEAVLGTSLNITSPNFINVEVDLTITSWDNPTIYWEYSTTWPNNVTNQLCVEDALLNYTDYRIDWIFGYDATDRVREFHYLDNGTLDKTGIFNSLTSNVTNFLDLESADSTTFLFSYTDVDGLSVPNSIVHTYRKYIGEGIFREVERSKQDNNGETHVHLVEEDVIYYFVISDDSQILFTSETYNAKCLSTPCAITLTGSSTETNWSIYDNEGGQYVITTDVDTRTATVTFNLNTVGIINASLYEYDDTEVTYIVSDSLTATSGSIDLFVPFSYGNSTYFITVYRDGVFVKSGWLDLSENGKDYFGAFGAFLGALIVLVIILMSISEGAGLLVFTALALVIIGVMQLVSLSWLAIISIVCAGAIILWKLTNRSRRKG